MVVTPLNLTAVPMCGVSQECTFDLANRPSSRAFTNNELKIKCLASGLSMSSCLSTNTTCFCLDQTYNDFVTSCVLGNCTVREQLCK